MIRHGLASSLSMIFPKTGSHFSGSCSKEPALVRVLVDIGGERPARELLVTGEPDVGELPDIFQDVLQHGCDQRPAAELAMNDQHQEAHGLILVQVVERALVDVEQITR